MAILTRLLNPTTTRALAYPAATLYAALTTGLASATAAGIQVTPEKALDNTTVLAAVRVLSEGVAALPLIVYERMERGKRRAPEHRLYPLLHDSPNPELTAFEWRELGMVHLTLWGNFYSEIEMDRAGRVLALWPLRPDRMSIGRVADRLVYEYDLGSGGRVQLGAERVFHVRGMGTDGVRGYSLVSLARQAIGLGLAAEEFGARFFGNGAVPGLVLQHPGTLGDDAHKRLRTSWNEMHQGLSNAQRVAILEEGLTVEKIGIPPEDAQFLETRKFQVSEVARIFRVPPHMLADLERATFSNIEHQGIEFVTHTLGPWLVRFEQAIQLRLMAPADRQRFFAEFLVDGLLRGDTLSRFQAYSVGRQWGWLSANEIREMENRNPVEGGDAYLTPMNMVEATDGESTAENTEGAEGEGQTAGGTEDERQQRFAEWWTREWHLQAVARTRAAADDAPAARHRLQATYRPVLANSAQRIVNREVNDIKNGAARLLGGDRRRLVTNVEVRADTGAGSEWDGYINRYYEQHERFITDYLAPVVNTYADLVIERVEQELGKAAPAENLRRFAGGVLASLASVWVGESKGRIRRALEQRQGEDPQTIVQDVLDEMQANRADDFAQDASVRVNNAVAVEGYGMMGVTSKRWVSFGENCPYCDELNGRSIEIGLAFLPADGVLAPAGQTIFRSGASIGHAPLHQGCDCMVVAG